jgi:son of sevenless-like protein
MSILAGLNSAPVHRLKRTFELLSTKTQATLETVRNLMSTTKNFTTYRESLRSSTGAAIPFLGCYLTDLTFIEDGNSDFLKTDARLINFSKRTKTGEVIREIQQYQSLPYNITPVPELQVFLDELLADQPLEDEGEMYDLSLQLEPREREDEKIARLLTESGFL